jgi:hypothetical protein
MKVARKMPPPFSISSLITEEHVFKKYWHLSIYAIAHQKTVMFKGKYY